MEIQQILILSGITLFASFVMSLSGFGFNLISMGFFTLFLAVREANVLVTFLMLPIIMVNLIILRKDIRLKSVLPVLIAAVAGLPIGVWGLVRLNERVLLVGLGAIILAAIVVNEITARGKARKPNIPAGIVAGLIGGLFGGAYAATGPPVVFYFSATMENKRELKAALLLVFFAQGFIRLIILAAGGIVSAGLAKSGLILLTPMVIGTVAGIILFNHVSSVWMRRIIQVILSISAVTLIIRAVV